MVCTHRMFHGMLTGQGTHGHDNTGQRIGKGNMLSCLQIGTVCHGTCQIAANILHGCQRIHVTHQIGRIGNIRFYAVEQCVKALKCGKFRRNRGHQLRINNGSLGEQTRVTAQSDFLVCFLVGNDAECIHFTAGSRCCGNRNHRKRIFTDSLALAGSAIYIIPQVALIGCHDGDCLGCVNHAAATQCNDKITALFLCKRTALHNGGFQRICHDFVKYHSFCASLLQCLQSSVKVSIGSGGFAVGNDNQCLFTRHLLTGQLVQASGTKNNSGRYIHTKTHNLSSCVSSISLHLNLFMLIILHGSKLKSMGYGKNVNKKQNSCPYPYGKQLSILFIG